MRIGPALTSLVVLRGAMDAAYRRRCPISHLLRQRLALHPNKQVGWPLHLVWRVWLRLLPALSRVSLVAAP